MKEVINGLEHNNKVLHDEALYLWESFTKTLSKIHILPEDSSIFIDILNSCTGKVYEAKVLYIRHGTKDSIYVVPTGGIKPPSVVKFSDIASLEDKITLLKYISRT